MDNPRVAIFASQFYPHIGGVEELVRQLGLEQKRRGNAPLIVTNRWPKDLPPSEVVDGLDVHRYIFRGGGRTLRRKMGAWICGSLTSRRIDRDLRENQIGLLHVQCMSSNAVFAAASSRRMGLPLVISLQGEFTMDANRAFERPEVREGACRILSQADAVTACSAQTLREAEEIYGSSLAHKARVVYNGICMEDFTQAEPFSWPRPYILAIGRHVPQKGLDVLIRALAEAKPPGLDLLIAGDGPETEELRKLAEGLPVHFLGRVDHAKAVSLFMGCHFFVLPSRHEPMGIVNLEAMAAGKVVIASNVGGVPELVVKDETGLLVPADDVPALARAISLLSGNAEMRDRLGAAGRKRAEQFTWPALEDQYEQVYQQAIAGRFKRGAAA